MAGNQRLWMDVARGKAVGSGHAQRRNAQRASSQAVKAKLTGLKAEKHEHACRKLIE